MTATRTFHIGDILSVTTGKLVSPAGMGGIHGLLDFMTSEPLMTHQIPRAVDECAPSLREQFPDLAAAPVPEDFGGSEQSVLLWLSGLEIIHGEFREVAALRPEDHTYIDPITELRSMAPNAEIIAIEVPGSES